MKKYILAVILASAMLLVAACTTDDGTIINGDDALPLPPSGDLVENGGGFVDDENDVEEEGDVVTFRVTGGPGFEFFVDGEQNPDMVVSFGDTVRIEFEVEGGMPHDWVLDAFGAATEVLSVGEIDVIEFVADQQGVFEYYCSVGAHRGQGMVGSFIVE